MNFPNAITAGRLLLAFLFFATLSVHIHLAASPPDPDPWILDVAFAIFVIAALSDALDGYVARRWNQVTAIGRLADPLVDKILVGGAFVYFLAIGPETYVRPWMVVLILAREFVVTAVRSMAERKGSEFGALYWGKAKMWVQCITVGIVLMGIAHFPGEAWAARLTQAAVYLTVLATVGSMVPYARKALTEVVR